MKIRTPFLFALLLHTQSAVAGIVVDAPNCSAEPQGVKLSIPQFTGYAPRLGGINGSCRGGASKHKGFPACTNTLHSYIEGKTKFMMVAAQQRGGSAPLFGCWAKVPSALSGRQIPTGGKECHIFAVVDRYGATENQGRRGVNGKIQGTKIDVEVAKLDESYKKLANGTAGSSEVQCIGRAAGMTNGENPRPKKIQRKAQATRKIKPRRVRR